MPMSRPETPGPSTIECRQIADLLSDYLDGSLPKHTRELLEWHIEGGGPCAATKLKEVEIPAELKQRLLAVLRNPRASRPPRA